MTETKGSVVNTVIWSVINDISDPAYVKQAYPVLTFVTQLGSILGSLGAVNINALGGVHGLLILQSVSLVAVIVSVWFACSSAAVKPSINDNGDQDLAMVRPSPEQDLRETPLRPSPLHVSPSMQNVDGMTVGTLPSVKSQNGGPTALSITGGRCGFGGPRRVPLPTHSESTQPLKPSRCRRLLSGTSKQIRDFAEGLVLILTRPYVGMVFWLQSAHLAIRAIIDYQGSLLVIDKFPDDRGTQIAFKGNLMLICSVTTALLTLLGTRMMVDTLGLTLSLVVYPLTMIAAMIAITFYYDFWVVIIGQIIINAVCYGLNGPCHEMLYIRTSREIKYRAKGWSSMYGSFVQKLIGSQINQHVNREDISCHPNCYNAFFSLAFAVVWTTAWCVSALGAGKIHAKLERENKIIE